MKNLWTTIRDMEKLRKASEVSYNSEWQVEITDEVSAKIAKVTVEGQKVTVEVTDSSQSFEGSTFRVIIYSSILKTSTCLSYLNKENNETTFRRHAVTFNDKPKATNTVNVYPPESNTPPWQQSTYTHRQHPNTPPPTTPDTPPAPIWLATGTE